MAKQQNPKETHLNMEDAVTQSETFIIKYKNAITGVIAAIVIIIAGYIMYTNLYAEPREEKAQVALFKGQAYFEQDAFEQALNGDSIGYTGFLKIIDEYGGTKAANLAKAYAGICYEKLGKNEEAIKMLESFKANDQMVAPAILGAAGNCYASLGELDKAASTLISAADKADNNALSPIFLKQAGEILTKQGQYDKAIEVFTKIKDKYAQSMIGFDIDKYIEQAKLMKK